MSTREELARLARHPETHAELTRIFGARMHAVGVGRDSKGQWLLTLHIEGNGIEERREVNLRGQAVTVQVRYTPRRPTPLTASGGSLK